MRIVLEEAARSDPSIGTATITSGKLKRSVDRPGNLKSWDYKPFEEPGITEFLRENVDILSGHQKFDTAEQIWPDLAPEAFCKFAFVRDPVHRFVSAYLYHRRGTLNEHEDLFRSLVKHISAKHEKGYANVYWRYLATTKEFEDPALSTDQVAQIKLVKERIDSLAMVGVVERWQQSMALLTSIWFDGQQRPTQFDNQIRNRMLTTDTSRTRVQRWVFRVFEKYFRMPQPSLTRRLVRRIQKDRLLIQQLSELLSYEQEIYDYAVEKHLQQCQQIGIS